MNKLLASAVALLLVFTFGCQPSGGGNPTPTTPEPVSTGTVAGSVKSTFGVAIENAKVSAGDIFAITDANGSFVLINVEVGESVSINAKANAFTANSEVISVSKGLTTSIALTLATVAHTEAINSAIPNTISYQTSRPKMQLALEKYLLSTSNYRIVKSELGYLHTEVKSDLIGFIDDVEFYLPKEENVIHIRSASRVGFSDFDVNRNRVRQITAALVK